MIAKNKRSLKNGFQYDNLISKADFETQTLSNFITVDDTVSSIIKIVQKTTKDTEKLAQILKRDTIDETCKEIWNFVYDHIQYVKDRTGYEELRRPARLWQDKKGDCDCYSIFIGSILYNLKIPFAFRVTKYSADWQHIYPIVYDKTSPKGYRIIDCVVDEYDYEVPYTDKQDTKMSTLYLSGFDTEDYDTETSIMEDLAGLGRAKNKAKAAKKAARKDKKTTKKAAKKQAKSNKKAAKKQAKTSKKASSKKNGKVKAKKKGGLVSRIKKGKEKRQIKRAAKKEKRVANPRKKGLFSKLREKKKAKREASKERKDREAEQTQNSREERRRGGSTQNETVERDNFDTSAAVEKDSFDTAIAIEKNEFSDTSSSTKPTPKEFMSDDGQDYNNQGSWGGDSKSKDKDPFFDTTQLDKAINQDVEKSQKTGREKFDEAIEEITETGVAIREARELQEMDNESNESEDDDEGSYPRRKDKNEGESKGDNFLTKAVNYTKENPLVVGGGIVGTGVAIWGISKLASSKPTPTTRTQRRPPRSVKPKAVNGLGGTKKKKGKSTLTSKAKRKHGRASFNGFN